MGLFKIRSLRIMVPCGIIRSIGSEKFRANMDERSLERDCMVMKMQIDDGEIVEKAADLDGRVIEAQKSRAEAEKLIIEFTPFLHRQVARYSSRNDEYQTDVAFSVAMSAFYEAITSFDAERGRFFPFADRVIRSRIIDHIREISRHKGKTVSLDDNDEEQQTARSVVISEISMRNFKEERRREMLADEIEQFKQEITEWGFTMEALVAASPKHKELRVLYYKIVDAVINNTDIMQTIMLKRYFPIKSIAGITGLPHKKLERARIFVVASLIIKTGDYNLLSDFLHR